MLQKSSQVNMCCTEVGVLMPGRVRGQQLAEAGRRVKTFCKQTNGDEIEKRRVENFCKQTNQDKTEKADKAQKHACRQHVAQTDK